MCSRSYTFKINYVLHFNGTITALYLGSYAILHSVFMKLTCFKKTYSNIFNNCILHQPEDHTYIDIGPVVNQRVYKLNPDRN